MFDNNLKLYLNEYPSLCKKSLLEMKTSEQKKKMNQMRYFNSIIIRFRNNNIQEENFQIDFST